MKNDIQFGPVNHTLDQLWQDPQVKARDMLAKTVDPATKRERYEPGYAFKFEDTPALLRRAPVPVADDTQAILRDAGYAQEDIARLKESGVIA